MKFSSVLGHKAVKERLLASGRDERVSHALLFLGPEGAGSLPLVIAFAQYLNCEEPLDDDSCGTCSSCIKMEKLVHPDVHFSYPVVTSKKFDKPKSVDYIEQFRAAFKHNPYMSYSDWMEEITTDNKQGSIFVQESADINQRLSLKGVEGKYKIVIIWYAEKMNTMAANKLLKILEEPPESTLFFLVSERYEELLATVTSRSQLIKVNRLGDAELSQVLVEKHGLDKIAARHVTHRSEGSYNQALKIVNNDSAITDLNQQFLSWMRHCLKLNISGINDLSVEFNDEPKEAQKVFLRHSLNIVRECLVINYGDRSLVRLEGKDLEDITRFAPFVTANNAEDFISELNKAHFHLERNANTKLLFTDLSLSLCQVLSNK